MALTPAEPNRDTLRDLLPIFMWDDEKPKPIGAIDHDGWGYIYYGPQYHYNAAMGFVPFNFAQAADAAIANNAQAANAGTANAPTPTNKLMAIYKGRWASIDAVLDAERLHLW